MITSATAMTAMRTIACGLRHCDAGCGFSGAVGDLAGGGPAGRGFEIFSVEASGGCGRARICSVAGSGG
ncbi:hypothetical protein ATO49_09860 [Mycolicibacterium fortuitum subsp. fortuitum DSM 46621 = ATCC 6841 = JCM 6387]|nr:hypothetical protein ATO49_09860 [Mycolicibacterium fortuitum subsp. fortuitum DSM 46621 = ATCC 6841 = JCM 6387]